MFYEKSERKMDLFLIAFGIAFLIWSFGNVNSLLSLTEIRYSDFNSGNWYGWSDGGQDTIMSTQRSACGLTTHSVNLQDEEEEGYIEQTFDFSNYDYVDISWSAYYYSLENDNKGGDSPCSSNNDCAECMELKINGNVIKTWGENNGAVSYFCDEDIQEGIWLDKNSGNGDSQYLKLICEEDINCSSFTSVKFEAEFSGDYDDVWIDCINITGFKDSEPFSYQCNDSIDNDGDSLIDYPEDPGCVSYDDNNEYTAECPGCTSLEGEVIIL